MEGGEPVDNLTRGVRVVCQEDEQRTFRGRTARVEVELGDADWDAEEPAPGVFGLPAERAGGGRGTVRFETNEDDAEKKTRVSREETKSPDERRRKKESRGDKKETKKRLFGGWGKGNP